jgi:aldehyde dehydrogenase (NAD+)
MTEIARYWPNYIDGAWTAGGSGYLVVDDPATGEALAKQACASAADIDRAVAAAQRCHQTAALSSMRPCDRGRKVRQMGEWLMNHSDEIAPILTREAGKPLWESRMEIESAARYFEYYGNQAETLEGRSIPLGRNYFDFTVYEPYGVSAQIVPWNYPMEMTARSLSAALAAGNACVVKTPELDPLTNAYFAKAAEAVDLPRGALNILCGVGQEAGAALAAHPGVNQLVFTGSVETGVRIATAAAQNVVPCILELGGKSAAIIYPDANLDAVMDSIRWGIFFNAGQVCSALSRAIVHESIYDELVERTASLARSLSVGPGIERIQFGANMGAMISEKQRDRAAVLCARAETFGARRVSGGCKLDCPGWFLEPTVFDRVTPDSEIAQTEVFGPVLSVLKFANDHEAMAIANGTQYGLVGGVFTADIERAMGIAQRLHAGQVFVNEWYAGGVETPFGGYGKSGYGREKGREALWNYVQTKNVAIRLGG